MNYNANEIITFFNKSKLSSLKELNEEIFNDLVWDLVDEMGLNGIGDTDWDCSYGATKGVLIPTDGDYVIKIPFTEIIQGAGLFKKKKRLSLFGFQEYCELEQFIYNVAMIKGLSGFFARTIKIGEVGKFSIYVQEKADANIGDWSDWTKKKENIKASIKIKELVSKKELKKVKKYCKKNKVKCFNAPFLALIEKSGKKDDVLKLCDFIEECTNDVHIGNLGFIKDRPVIIDYSGYYE